MDLFKQKILRENLLKSITLSALVLFIVSVTLSVAWGEGPAFSDPNEKLTYPIVDTFMARCHDNNGEIPCPKPGEPFYGQGGQKVRS